MERRTIATPPHNAPGALPRGPGSAANLQILAGRFSLFSLGERRVERLLYRYLTIL